ncbi:MAG: ABC transporter ATP-binding protein [Gammaproteobacteria bacterium]
MSGLEIRNVWKSYADQVVLERIALRVAPGEFCTIVGASGCGKSTFLRMLLGAETPSRGAILLDGEPLPIEPDPHRGIVFQRYSVFPHLSAIENVLLGLELQAAPLLGRFFGARRRDAAARARRMLEAVGLAGDAGKYPAELSGGMQQRLAIAQSLIVEPRVLLLDEPFAALDPGIRADMQGLVRSLWNERRITVFMVTHDIEEAFRLGTRVLVFDKPRLDPHAPGAYGAQITYDIALDRADRQARAAIEARLNAARPAPTDPPMPAHRQQTETSS